MKKFLAIVMILAFSSIVYAREVTKTQRMTDSAGTAITAYSLTSGTAVYSDTITVNNNAGFISLLLTEGITGGSGDVDVSVEYSVDGTNFYTGSNTDMSGTLTDDGNIATAFGNKTRLIAIPARLANYFRIKFDPDANSVITADTIYLESY